MSKALFFRKCSNEQEYLKLSNDYPYLGNNLEFEVVATILLTPDEYFNFKNNFLVDSDNIKKITKKLYMDENDKVYCAYVTDGCYGGYLVYPSGYNYARYVARYFGDNEYLKGEKNV